MANRKTISFFYVPFFPIKGGAAVHGYNLAKELSILGYKITSFNNENYNFLINKRKNIYNILKAIAINNITYIRQGLSINYRTYAIILAKILRKKVIVEMNSISEELRINGIDDKRISKLDKKLKFFLSFSDCVIVVSDKIRQYCNTALRLKNVVTIENGGELIDLKKIHVNKKLQHKINKIESSYEKLVIWSGRKTPWQGYDKVSQVIEKSPKNTAFILICNDENIFANIKNKSNVFFFHDLERDEVKYIIKKCHIGLVLYSDYNWTRYGFYGSSLKYYEYLINGLNVIASPLGKMATDDYENLYISDNIKKIVGYIKTISIKKKYNCKKCRSWNDVANEVDCVIKKI